MRARPLSILFVIALSTASGCAASKAVMPLSATPADAPAAAAPAPLTRSLFARDPQGQLTEEALQKILEAPLDVSLPSRVGVLPILPAVDHRGPGPSYLAPPAGASPFTAALRGAEHFPLVTEVLPIPSGALGMEALREIAARYRLRYLLLYREEVSQRVRANGWAAGYVTGLGALFLPGQTLSAAGHVEASLFDVKTGTLLYTVRRPVYRKRLSNVWHQEDKLGALIAAAVIESAPDLAGEVRAATRAYVEAIREESGRQAAALATGPGG